MSCNTVEQTVLDGCMANGWWSVLALQCGQWPKSGDRMGRQP
jgi:hypothetical protein